MSDVKFSPIVKKWLEILLNYKCLFFTIPMNLLFKDNFFNFRISCYLDSLSSIAILTRFNNPNCGSVLSLYSLKLFKPLLLSSDMICCREEIKWINSFEVFVVPVHENE